MKMITKNSFKKHNYWKYMKTRKCDKNLGVKTPDCYATFNTIQTTSTPVVKLVCWCNARFYRGSLLPSQPVTEWHGLRFMSPSLKFIEFVGSWALYYTPYQTKIFSKKIYSVPIIQ